MDAPGRWLVRMGQVGSGFAGTAGDPFLCATEGLTGADLPVYADTNANCELDGTDPVLHLQNVQTPAEQDFEADTFRVKVGDAQPNLISGTAFGDTIFGLGGADRLTGLPDLGAGDFRVV